MTDANSERVKTAADSAHLPAAGAEGAGANAECAPLERTRPPNDLQQDIEPTEKELRQLEGRR